MTWKYRNEVCVMILFILITVLTSIWMMWMIVVPKPIEYKESPQERKRIETRIAYHGLSGVVVLRESKRGWEFKRDGQWCKL